MRDQLSRFRGQVESHFGGRPGRGARYPAAVRAQAVELATAAMARGEGLASVAAALGVGIGTLRRWMETAAPRAGQLRQVELVEASASPTQARSTGHGLTLVTASGHRVKGLALAQVALLLEALG